MGRKKSETGIEHLERNDFIIQKQENKKRKFQEEAENAIAEKEEAEEQMQTAREAIEGMRQERMYLVEGNCTKDGRKKRLDMEIQGKKSHSKSLYHTGKEQADKPA